MKTPDEIKKGLANNIPVHYHPGDHEPRLTPLMMVDLEELHADALALIQQLESERDAAVADIDEMAKCITDDVCEWCDQTECERLCMMHATERPGFKWRGIQKEGEG